VGKTRLALRAAAGLRRAFRDGVWLVRLNQLRDQALVTQAVAGALGARDRAGYAPAAALAEYLDGRQLTTRSGFAAWILAFHRVMGRCSVRGAGRSRRRRR
jgi:predicted ATPase